MANWTGPPSPTWRAFLAGGSVAKYLPRDRDGIYSPAFSVAVRALGLRQLVSAYSASRMNAHPERLIGSLRRECLDPVIVMGEGHARRQLDEYAACFNAGRSLRALDGDTPEPRERASPGLGEVVGTPVLGGLHHTYRGDGLTGADRPSRPCTAFSGRTGARDGRGRRWRARTRASSTRYPTGGLTVRPARPRRGRRRRGGARRGRGRQNARAVPRREENEVREGNEERAAGGEVLPAIVNGAAGLGVVALAFAFGGPLPALGGARKLLGIALVYAGMALVVWAAAHLRAAIAGMVAPRLAHLVTSGPYRRVRHPVYLGTAVALVGVALASGSWIALLAVLALFLPSAVHRARREERALGRAFGREWREYAARTPFLLPALRAPRQASGAGGEE